MGNKCWKCEKEDAMEIEDVPIYLLDLLCFACKVEYLKELMERRKKKEE